HILLPHALALQGVARLAEALTLIDALLRDYWTDLHPRLDADDDNDPTVRINALTGLTCETNIRLLRESILTRSRTFGPV
ncbi:type VI secretion system protein TssA, partial [Pseudomonas fragi]